MIKKIAFSLCVFSLYACQAFQTNNSLYNELGGQTGIENIADRFVRLIIKDPRTEKHFEESDLDRFYEKLVEQFCEVSDGPCTYSGDSMVEVHKGMKISEAEFNATVELLQEAMRDNKVTLSAQNRLLALLAPMRKEMLEK